VTSPEFDDAPFRAATARKRTDSRIFHVPEIAPAVLYFLTASNFVTGQVLAVDGGLSPKLFLA
jgi:NAD(P)-dependent dehydrogenase (short-subunit alcohol dehydrogenase family)